MRRLVLVLTLALHALPSAAQALTERQGQALHCAAMYALTIGVVGSDGRMTPEMQVTGNVMVAMMLDSVPGSPRARLRAMGRYIDQRYGPDPARLVDDMRQSYRWCAVTFVGPG